MYLFNIYQILFILPGLILGIAASLLIKFWNNKYSQIRNINSLTGVEVVEKLARKNNLDIRLEVNDTLLGDHYNPSNSTLSLSRSVAQEPSIASVAIAAHEMGHVQQHKSRNLLMTARNAIVPAINLGTSLGYILIVIGIIIEFADLAWVGVILFSGATIFTLLTLPIELDASRRALNMIKKDQLLFFDELGGARKVLFAAALTYVAAMLQSLGNLLYFVFRIQGIGSRRD